MDELICTFTNIKGRWKSNLNLYNFSAVKNLREKNVVIEIFMQQIIGPDYSHGHGKVLREYINTPF